MGVSYSVPYQPSPNQPSPHQVNPHQPSFEEILTESLKPFDLKNAETCRHFLQSLLIEFKSNKDLKQTLGLRSASIESSMIPFLQKLESLSTKEKRREWFRSTYYRKRLEKDYIFLLLLVSYLKLLNSISLHRFSFSVSSLWVILVRYK